MAQKVEAQSLRHVECHPVESINLKHFHHGRFDLIPRSAISLDTHPAAPGYRDVQHEAVADTRGLAGAMPSMYPSVRGCLYGKCRGYESSY